MSRDQVKTVGDLANCTRINSSYSMNLIRQGAFKVNGMKYTDPEARLDVGKLLLKERYTLVNWGRRRFVVVDWIN